VIVPAWELFRWVPCGFRGHARLYFQRSDMLLAMDFFLGLRAFQSPQRLPILPEPLEACA
jgi:hypothetical protein